MTEVEQAPQNGIDLNVTAAAVSPDDDDNNKARPADIEQDMREMERRKRVEAIMGSKLFREELERIVDSAREGGATGILQQLSDIVGVPSARVGSVFKATNCMLPINDIRGVESMGYAKGEKILRCKLAATFRLLDLNGWTQGLGAQITARLKVDQEYFLVNPYGLLYHEITASSLNKVDMQGQIVEQGTTNFGVNRSHFILHSVVHAARPDIRCAIYIGCSPVVAVSSLKTGLLPLTKDACVLGEISTHPYTGSLLDAEERDKLVRNLGPNSKVMLLSNHGALCCGETVEEAFYAACHIVQACETQLKLLPVGVENLSLIAEESRKTIYEQSRRPPEDLEKKFAAAVANVEAREAAAAAAAAAAQGGDDKEAAAANTTITTTTTVKVGGTSPKWRVGGAEFEALMRMLDNAGYRTGYIYRHPLVKSEPPKPKNDVELPPAVSSLGYLLEEEELFRQGIWKKGDIRKGGDRSKWLNSPNVYQKVEVLETGTPDPKKITKWVAEGSPTHSTPVRIEDPLQFVPAGTNPKEFKRLQQQIKDNRRADKISAGPQSHILEGVTWDEANRIKDATVSSAGDHVVLMGAASKGIIQRGFQHNATVYKAPYAKNPFDNVTDDELNEYKRTVERKKKSIHGEYTDTDFSESEALSSLQTSGAQQTKQTTTTTTAAVSQSEPEDVSEHQVMRIETQQAPVPSQPEVVLSDATLNFINGERSHTATNQKPPNGRDTEEFINLPYDQVQDSAQVIIVDDEYDDKVRGQANKENVYRGSHNIKPNTELIAELKNDLLFQRQKHKLIPPQTLPTTISDDAGGSSSIPNPNPPVPSFIEETLDSCTKHPPLLPNSNSSNTFVVLPSFEQTFGKILPHNIDCCNFYLESYASSPHYYESINESANSAEYIDINAVNPLGDGGGMSVCYDDHDNIYKKSLFCYTPKICDTIFQALQKPSHDNDLIFNIPFSVTSPAHSTTGSTGTTPRKCRADSPYKKPKGASLSSSNEATSPFRTVSHFGFNSPQRGPQPEHKHIPCAAVVEPKKYVPIHKSISYEEIFSSPRYVDLCENCFEKIVRIKPELIQMQTRLRNIADFNQHQIRVGGPESVMVSYQTTTDASVVTGYGGGNYDYVECPNSAEMTEPQPVFSSQLEPVPEVEEAEASGSSEGHQNRHIPINKNSESNSSPVMSNSDKTTSNSTFIDRITRMNYSEESTNSNFLRTPRTVSSDITVEMEEDDIDEINHNDSVSIKKAHVESSADDISNAVAALDIRRNGATGASAGSTEDGQGDLIELHASVTEIWEFGNWLEQSQPQEKSLNQQKSLTEAENTLVLPNASSASGFGRSNDSSTANDVTGTGDTSAGTGGNIDFGGKVGSDTGNFDDIPSASVQTDDSASYQQSLDNSGSGRRRSLMSREERYRRKLEFQELWEDHIAFFDGKEQDTLSDTESAKDEIAGRNRAHQREPKKEIEQHQNSDSVPLNKPEREVFHGRSLIVKSPLCVVTDTNKVEANREAQKEYRSEGDKLQFVEQDDATSSDGCHSAHTYNVYRSHDNLLFRTGETLDSAGNSALSRIDNETAELDGITYSVRRHRSHGDCDTSEEETPAYTATIEEFELYKQHTTVYNSSSQTNVNEFKSDTVDTTKEIELEYSQLVEANTGSEDTNLSENFEEILIAVQNLQITNANSQNVETLQVAEEKTENSAGNDRDDRNDDVGDEDDDSKQFSSLERKILKKIEINQLKDTEEIFDKIELTIRNKLTPCKLEQLVRKQKQQLLHDADTKSSSTTANTFVALSSTPESSSLNSFHLGRIFEGIGANSLENSEEEEVDSGSTLRQKSTTYDKRELSSSSSLFSQKHQHSHHTRRSRSLTPCTNFHRRRLESPSPAPYSLSQTSSPPRAPRKDAARQERQRTPDSAHVTHELFPIRSTTSTGFKRNFVLENIRNAAIPRNNVAVKRLQGNAQAIFCRNPFGGGGAATTSSSTTSVGSHGSNNASMDNTPVYAFQSKLVRGSPRFWLSMTQSPAKKLQAPSQNSLQKRRNKQQPKLGTKATAKTCDSTCTLDGEEESKEANELLASGSSIFAIAATQVDAEFVALGAQIDQIHPRLETYKRKLDDLGETVAKCARNMDECVEEQQDIIQEQHELREQILLHQYVEDIACQVQTFSISETED